jgi:hypothetical protein
VLHGRPILRPYHGGQLPQPARCYLYSFAGYVLGQMSPTGTLQTIPLTDEDDNPIDIQSTGPLTVAFLADPFQANLPWWRQAYTKPDVGLNHPERWDWSKTTQTATFNPADRSSSSPQDQAFYHIKGFFITPADATGTGPQLSRATAGDTLQLQARVYNFSLADMPAGTQVHAQFYAQVYENARPVGDSFMIGEAVLGPLPGFNSASTNGTVPNWALASTTFDTGAFDQTKNGDVYLIFWVVVWIQDGQGNILPELPGHGLTSGSPPPGCPFPPPICPPNPSSPAPYTQITDVPIEDYSNNVGFLRVSEAEAIVSGAGDGLAITVSEVAAAAAGSANPFRGHYRLTVTSTAGGALTLGPAAPTDMGLDHGSAHQA